MCKKEEVSIGRWEPTFSVLSRYEKYQGRRFYGCCSRSVVSGWILLSLCIETNDRAPIDYNAIKFLTFIIPD